jgi:hypothetical protein
MIWTSAPPAAALSTSEPPSWASWTCPESSAATPFVLDTEVNETSRPFREK